MKLQHVIQAVYFSPWNITQEGWQAVHAIVRPHLASGGLSELVKAATVRPKLNASENLDALSDDAFGEIKYIPKSDSSDTDIFGESIPQMEIRPNGVCIIPIVGTLIHHATMMDKQCGACSYDDVKDNVRQAMDTPGISKIVLHVDSPGGMSMGCHECAKAVELAAEFFRVEAVTDSLMCSAAYELCASATAIYCTPTAYVGSIGTLLPWLDQTVRYEMMGLKQELFTSGDLKGSGWPGTELTTAQRENFQATVDKLAGMFKDHVLAHRLVDGSAMRGQSLVGSDAVTAGLVDELIDDVEDRFDPTEDDTD